MNSTMIASERLIHDRVTTLGAGVDGTIRRRSTTYDVLGRRAKLTSYDSAAVGSGAIINEVELLYNEFGQLIADYQAHSGAVDRATTPKGTYDYADGSANTIRPTAMTYPNGREIGYDYSTAGSLPDAISRVDALRDGAEPLVHYSYLGLNRFVIAGSGPTGVNWTQVSLTGTNDPHTGDIYTGLDRFGRVKDNRWHNAHTSTDLNRMMYGYDRAGNRTWQQNIVAGGLGQPFDEAYRHDGLQRLQEQRRGVLDAQLKTIGECVSGQCWTLDSTGNWAGMRQSFSGCSTWDLVQYRTANGVNEITDITNVVGPAWAQPAYDAAGNMTTLPQPGDTTDSYTATYDAWNRLVKLTDGANTVAEYQYDGANRRTVQKTYASGVLSETRHLYYSDPAKWQVIEERVGAAPETAPAERQHVWGLRYIDDLVLRDRDTNGNGTLDERLYACQDANWNVTALFDPTGAVVERYTYSAYGTPLFLTPGFAARSASEFGWETLYCGYRYEAATGLFHVRHRVYLPAFGVWAQRDPLKQLSGPNLYHYAHSRPLVARDAYGLIAEEAGFEQFLSLLDFWERLLYYGPATARAIAR